MNADYRIPMSTEQHHLYYFAYGSNMCREQMKKRCPRSEVYATGKLRGWEFLINERGVATLIKSTGHTIGVIYRVSHSDLAYLDIYEGVKTGLYGRFTLLVKVRNVDAVRTCTVYIDPSTSSGVPRPGYMERVIKGAKENGLPRRYIQKLRKWKRLYDYEDNKIGSRDEFRFRVWDFEKGWEQSFSNE